MSSVAGLSYTGEAEDGEVEDYQVEIVDPGEIHGVKWNDLNGNGLREANEPGLQGWEIFLDTETGEILGSFTLGGSNRQSALGGDGVAPGVHFVTVGSGEIVQNKNFGNRRLSEIRGTKWNDLDEDGIWDDGESGLEGWRIYADYNNNGRWDRGEPFGITDEDGRYGFEVQPGTYVVREMGVPGWNQTFPEAIEELVTVPLPDILGAYENATIRAADFDAGVRFSEISGVSLHWTGQITSGLGDGDGVEAPAGNPFDWPGAFSAFTPDRSADVSATIRGGAAYDDPDPFDEVTPFGSRFGEPGFEFLLDGQGELEVAFGSDFVMIGGVMLEPPRGEIVTAALQIRGTILSGAYHTVEVLPAQIIDNVTFGNYDARPLSEIHGGKWNDLDGDGVWDDDEPGLAGWKIYLDENEDGQWSDDEPFQLTDVDGNYSLEDLTPGIYIVAEESQDGWEQTFPEPGPVFGERVSVGLNGEEGDNGSLVPSMSADGRYVAFASYASNLVPEDTNGVGDIFVYDRREDVIERVSIASDGSKANGASRWAFISADGRYVAFESDASSLVAEDTNDDRDIFVYDRETGTIERVSIALDGSEANNSSYQPSISADGRYVAFHSEATNLVSEDTNGVADVFVSGVGRVSLAYDGTEANGTSDFPSIRLASKLETR